MDRGFFLAKDEIERTIEAEWGIKIPRLYRMGFDHNNCGGGCVRGKKGHWKRLLETLPDVYAERERMEREFRKNFPQMKYTILEGISLADFRNQQLRQPTLFSVDENGTVCVCFEVDE